MKWSYRIANISGIDIKVHATFLLIVLFFGFQWSIIHGAAGFVFGAALIIALFACVVLHELGHSLAAQYFGINVREIILLPLGGLALLERNATKPVQEFVIALAGPLVNVVIAVVLLVVIALSSTVDAMMFMAMVQGINADLTLSTFLNWLFEANVLLVLFNMIPAFPLDGGRILRSVLAMAMGFRRATRIASRVGQGFAILMGVFAFFTLNFFLGLIALFIFFGAGQENAQEVAGTALRTRRVGDAYNKHVLTLGIGDRLSKVIDYVLCSYQPDFAVLQGNQLLGVVTRDDALRALASAPAGVYIPDAYVTMVMQRNVARVSADATLEEVRQMMTERGLRVVAVYEGEMYLGLVNMDDIAEAFTVLTYTERYERNNPRPSPVESVSADPGEAGTS
jgi:Zn-dependent protease